ncbi:MAG: tryptophan--tRNA ligase [Thermoguttaceae bacterium]|nr:tryptophan--tRNA ligase [Thermoguttaceae bacterium]
MRILSGIQPTGNPHWGNYFGANRQYVTLQSKKEDAFYFIANLHALTTVRDKERLSQATFNMAVYFLAIGLDPEKSTLFVQSDVPEVTQLTWLLLTCCPMGLLERCHAYKEKLAKGLTADAGLFTYPVLMAADILAYDSDCVPVGEDQQQHLEVARDLAQTFNYNFGETFVLPKAYVVPAAGKVPGTDGEKMSKSYNNTLEVIEDVKVQKKKIMRIETDCRPMEDPKDPETDNLYLLYKLFASEEQRAEMEAMYRRGGFGYGQVKKELARIAEEYFAPIRERYAKYIADPDYVRDVLKTGAARARAKAAEVLDRAQSNCGIGIPK